MTATDARRGLFASVLGLVALAASAPARGATVTVRGPAACADADSITEQAGELLGRPLADVPGIDFEVSLSRAASGWTLHLDTVETTADRPRRSREIHGSKCSELADAAAVGIAMSVRALGAPAVAAPPPPVAVAAPTPATPAVATIETATARPAASGRVAVIGDSGALPGPTAGIELAAALRLSRVRVGLSGSALAPRTAHLSGDTGGAVNLLFGAVELCAPAGGPSIEVYGCGAFEGGRLSAEGVGITRPRLGSVLWEAARAELGLGLPLRPRLTLVVRGGAALALSRPQFVINGTTLVHRPSALSARAAAGLEFEF